MMGRFGYDVRKDIRRINHDGDIRMWYVGITPYRRIPLMVLTPSKRLKPS